MESLIFEVKLMLENNDASAAFWLGNLKHRNLAGEEISSQLPVISEDEQDEDVVDEIASMSESGESSRQLAKKATGKNPKKRARAATPKKKKQATKATKTADSGDMKTKTTAATADKKVTAPKKRKPAERDAEAESARIHTMRYVFIWAILIRSHSLQYSFFLVRRLTFYSLFSLGLGCIVKSQTVI